jgi:hypothetical protein
MKRLHVHVSVKDLATSIRFYSRLFAAEPSVRKEDYARWMLDDPRVRPVIEEGETTCCYAHSEKSWIDDPQGVQWETFLTSGESTAYGTDLILEEQRQGEKPGCAPSCCSPAAA